MSKKRTSPILQGKADWARLDALTEQEVRTAIDADPDAHPTDEDFWKTAEVVMPQPKETITIRLDPDVLQWFRKHGKGYQTRINAVLRAYIQAHSGRSSP